MPALARQHSSGTLVDKLMSPWSASSRGNGKKAAVVVRGDISPLALAPQQQVFRREFIDRRRIGTLADAKAASQLGLVGNNLARSPFTAFQRLKDQALDLPIERD